jgi:hypothetical protein
MAFKSLSSVILSNIFKETARANSVNLRFGSATAANLGVTKVTKQPTQTNITEFIWGGNQGVWGKNQITIDYKP